MTRACSSSAWRPSSRALSAATTPRQSPTRRSSRRPAHSATIDHVSTQLPYVGVVATCSFFGYIVDGLTENGWLGLLTGIICLAIAMVIIRVKVPAIEEEKG